MTQRYLLAKYDNLYKAIMLIFGQKKYKSNFVSLHLKLDNPYYHIFRSSECKFEDIVLHGFSAHKWKIKGKLIEIRNSGLDNQCKVRDRYFARTEKNNKQNFGY